MRSFGFNEFSKSRLRQNICEVIRKKAVLLVIPVEEEWFFSLNPKFWLLAIHFTHGERSDHKERYEEAHIRIWPVDLSILATDFYQNNYLWLHEDRFTLWDFRNRGGNIVRTFILIETKRCNKINGMQHNMNILRNLHLLSSCIGTIIQIFFPFQTIF